jgi:fumarate reductase subunit C
MADPRPPDRFPVGGRYLSYVLFGACGGLLMLSALIVLRAVWALGEGEGAWQELLGQLASPAYVIYHVIAFVGIVWFTLRFFRLFPKTQPPKIGPAPRPPDAFFAVALNGAFAVVTAALAAVLWGVVP